MRTKNKREDTFMIDPDRFIYGILEEEGKKEGIVKKTLKGAGKVLGTAAGVGAGVAGGMAAHQAYQDYQKQKHWEEFTKALGDFKLN
jgi:uncharacterized membrane protein YebE (DUF533 family)